MSKLSANEMDLLERIKNNKDLRPLFFEKVKGLKWFDELEKQEYFKPESNPKPMLVGEGDYIRIIPWQVTKYLVKTAPELANNNNDYAKKFLTIIVETTRYAKANNFNNFQTWWNFSKIILHIPTDIIEVDYITEIIDYWLDDDYDTGSFIAEELGEQWLPKLLQVEDDHSIELAIQLIAILYKAKEKNDYSFRLTDERAQIITEKVTSLAKGKHYVIKILFVFDTQLKELLDKSGNDTWSYSWRPAIEEHEQNHSVKKSKNILIVAYRDMLINYINYCFEKNNIEAVKDYIKDMLASNYETIHRLAIYAINVKYTILSALIDTLLNETYFKNNYRHEMWLLLKEHYPKFTSPQQKKILDIINNIQYKDDDQTLVSDVIARYKVIWLTAIKEYGSKELMLYEESISTVGFKPAHPDFVNYVTCSQDKFDSPLSLEELQILESEQLIEKLNNFSELEFRKKMDLAMVFEKLIVLKGLEFCNQLNHFLKLDSYYYPYLIQAYNTLWTEKASLPWNNTWEKLFSFCLAIIQKDNFFNSDNGVNLQIISNICRLISAGTQTDEHAFDEKYLDKAKQIIVDIINNVPSKEFGITKDAVSIAINSPRGHCFQALINLTLHKCRLADKNMNNHSEIWAEFQVIYDKQLARKDDEFITIVSWYLANFYYMSKKWTLNNLATIFNQDDYVKWLYAMQGYAAINSVYGDLYDYLKKQGHFLKALDDDNLKEIHGRIIEIIVIAYFNNYESFSEKESLINILFSRKNDVEIKELITSISSFSRNKKDSDNIKTKVFELWKKILDIINLETKEGRQIATSLSYWFLFIDNIDDTNKELLLKVTPYCSDNYLFLENIKRISHTQPKEAYDILIKLLEKGGYYKNYSCSEDVIKEILQNLINLPAEEGKRKAKDIASLYAKNGNENPSIWLNEIINPMASTL
ncbi:MAG: hypothetical protein WAX77_09145 [Methylococcaceae bacterium]